MKDNELQHIGVLGMKWGHRKAENNARNATRAKARGEAIKVAEQLEGLRKQRKTSTKFVDALLSGPYTGKLYSEKHGSDALAKKSSDLHNKLADIRRQRSRGQVITDYLLTVNRSTKTWSELDSKKKTKAIALTAAIVAGSIGLQKVSGLY